MFVCCSRLVPLIHSSPILQLWVHHIGSTCHNSICFHTELVVFYLLRTLVGVLLWSVAVFDNICIFLSGQNWCHNVDPLSLILGHSVDYCLGVALTNACRLTILRQSWNLLIQRLMLFSTRFCRAHTAMRCLLLYRGCNALMCISGLIVV